MYTQCYHKNYIAKTVAHRPKYTFKFICKYMYYIFTLSYLPINLLL